MMLCCTLISCHRYWYLRIFINIIYISTQLTVTNMCALIGAKSRQTRKPAFPSLVPSSLQKKSQHNVVFLKYRCLWRILVKFSQIGFCFFNFTTMIVAFGLLLRNFLWVQNCLLPALPYFVPCPFWHQWGYNLLWILRQQCLINFLSGKTFP